jgi:Flavin containing amine oxidoreductase
MGADHQGVGRASGLKLYRRGSTRLSGTCSSPLDIGHNAKILLPRATPIVRNVVAALATPVDDRLFFAGEACSEHDYSTAHGAYLTGVAAADQAIAARRGQTAR